MNNPVAWFEIYVDDLDKARAFYQTVFAVELMQLSDGSDGKPEMWAFPWQEDGAGAAGAICKMRGVEPGGNSTMVYFSCEDCAVEEARVNGAGGKVINPKMSISEYGFISIATDPDGNCIGLHSQA